MSTRQKILIDNGYVASEAITAFTGVAVSGGEAEVAAANTAVDGIALNDVTEAGQMVYVAEVGLTTGKVGTAASITAGDIVTVDASGELVALAGTSNFGNIRANEDAGADGDYISIYIDIYNNSNETEGA